MADAAGPNSIAAETMATTRGMLGHKNGLFQAVNLRLNSLDKRMQNVINLVSLSTPCLEVPNARKEGKRCLSPMTYTGPVVQSCYPTGQPHHAPRQQLDEDNRSHDAPLPPCCHCCGKLPHHSVLVHPPVLRVHSTDIA